MVETAKLFKMYDVKYARFKGTAFKELALQIGDVPYRELSTFEWNQDALGIRYRTYNVEDVHRAVYHSANAERWQKFRVSLKGLSTREKLYCLADYWKHCSRCFTNEIRVNNYIGALIRGGQLSSDLKVRM